jgi:hypothetical protein
MVKQVTLDLIDAVPNAYVLRHPQRRFPGILVQGDSLHIMWQQARQVREAVQSGRLSEDDLGEAEALAHGLGRLVVVYEAALGEAGIELPYVPSSPEKAEYLIRTAHGMGPLLLHRDHLSDVLDPHGFGAQVIADPQDGDFRLWLGPAEAVFYAEEVGWHVVIEGEFPEPSADELIGTVTHQLEQATGATATWIRLTNR